MTALKGLTQDGKESAHSLANTGRRLYLVVEQDIGILDEQAAILWHLSQRAPLALVLHSAGKSLHAWFSCVGGNDQAIEAFMRHAVSLGADSAPWLRSQFVRMPDGTRHKEVRQSVFDFNPPPLSLQKRSGRSP